MIINKGNDVKQLERFFSRIANDINKYSVLNDISLFPAEMQISNGNILGINSISNKWKKLNRFHLFKENRKYYWIKKNIKLPKKSSKEGKYFFKFKCGDVSEELLFINKKRCCAISTVLWDDGKPFSLPDELREGERVEFLLNLFTGNTDEDFVGQKPQLLSEFSLLEVYYPGWELYISFAAALEAAISMGKESYYYNYILEILEKVWKIIDFSDKKMFVKTVPEALKLINNSIYNGDKKLPIRVGVFGHAHLDVAWLWTLKETEDKAVRMFSTQINLIKKYPNWIYQQGQAQLYEYVKNKAPELYEEVKESINSGRWEPSGANWVEFDTNMSGGESIIRQIMYGKEFFKKEFNYDNKVLWMPDVFGYSGALPQILKKSGIELFITTKISWNDTTRFPYDTFKWKGIDGSEIITHFVTTPMGKAIHTYNTMGRAKEAWETYVDYQEKNINSELVMPFGYGDGGGGPKEEMVKRMEFLEKGMSGFIDVEYMGLEKYNKILQKSIKNKEVPIWNGELYLEFHRGVYTTQAKIKENNRKAEFLLRFLDMIILLSENKDNYFQEVKKLWKIVLLNQFHDILPGSSIREVYEISEKQFEGLYKKAKEIVGKIEKEIIVKNNKYVTLYNPYSWEYRGYVNIGDKTEHYSYVENIDPLGFLTINKDRDGGLICENIVKKDIIIENKYYKFKINSKNGNIYNFVLKNSNKEISVGKEELNVFEIYEDKSIFDFESAWDMEYMHQYKKYAETGELISPIKIQEFKGYKKIIVERNILHSYIKQEIMVFENEEVLHFKTKINWQEEDCVLKVKFPVSIYEQEATYNIQFGAIQRATYRNTVYEHTKFEVPAQKWVDLSESDYGVSIITNSKYGYSVKDNVMRITLLRAPINPDKTADRGEHIFEYGLYGHQGEWFKSDVNKLAYQLNFPAVVLRGKIKDEKLINMNNIDIKYIGENLRDDTVIVETIKLSEDGNGIILRMYESKDTKGEINLKFNLPEYEFKEVWLCNLLEEKEKILVSKYNNTNKSIRIKYKPYEIITLKFCFKKKPKKT